MSADPDEDESVHDGRLRIPALQDFFAAHPLVNPNTFLGDAPFDSAKLYNELLSKCAYGTDIDGSSIHFQKAFIPLNSRSGLENTDYSAHENGIPHCPNVPSLPMKCEDTSRRRDDIVRHKFKCPKVESEKNISTGKYRRVCYCDTPCTSSSYRRMVCLYLAKDLRAYPNIVHGTDQLMYKIRTAVERSTNHFKDRFSLARRKNSSC